MHRFLLIVLLLTLYLPAYAQAPVCESKTRYSFGMVPVAAANLFSIWSKKINRELNKTSCTQLDFLSAGNFKSYIAKAENRDFNLVAVPAHLASYLITHYDYLPVAFLQWESSYLFVTKRDSGISTLQQLAGAKVALPDPLAETSILAKLELQSFKQPAQYQHYQNYNLVLHALMNSSADAAVMISPFYNGYKARPHFNNTTQVIHTTPFPSHGMLLATPEIPKPERESLFTTLAGLKSGSGFLWDAFVPVSKKQLDKFHQQQQSSVIALEKLLRKQ